MLRRHESLQRLARPRATLPPLAKHGPNEQILRPHRPPHLRLLSHDKPHLAIRTARGEIHPRYERVLALSPPDYDWYPENAWCWSTRKCTAIRYRLARRSILP